MRHDNIEVRSFIRLDSPIKTETNGDSLWTAKARSVDIHDIEICGFVDYENNYFSISVNAYLPDDWDSKVDGLVYTDKGWIKSFREGFGEQFPQFKQLVNFYHLHYSELGMQGDNFVNVELIVSGKDEIDAALAIFKDMGIPVKQP